MLTCHSRSTSSSSGSSIVVKNEVGPWRRCHSCSLPVVVKRGTRPFGKKLQGNFFIGGSLHPRCHSRVVHAYVVCIKEVRRRRDRSKMKLAAALMFASKKRPAASACCCFDFSFPFISIGACMLLIGRGCMNVNVYTISVRNYLRLKWMYLEGGSTLHRQQLVFSTYDLSVFICCGGSSKPAMACIVI